MEPYREGEKPVEVYNKTEVELARIREQEETKRSIVAAREKTRQTARSNDGYWVVRGMAIVGALLGTLIVSLAGYSAYSDKMHAEHPGYTDSHCIESAEVISVENSARTCANGGWFESLPTDKPGHILVKCHCTPKPATTSPTPGASSTP